MVDVRVTPDSPFLGLATLLCLMAAAIAGHTAAHVAGDRDSCVEARTREGGGLIELTVLGTESTAGTVGALGSATGFLDFDFVALPVDGGPARSGERLTFGQFNGATLLATGAHRTHRAHCARSADPRESAARESARATGETAGATREPAGPTGETAAEAGAALTLSGQSTHHATESEHRALKLLGIGSTEASQTHHRVAQAPTQAAQGATKVFKSAGRCRKTIETTASEKGLARSKGRESSAHQGAAEAEAAAESKTCAKVADTCQFRCLQRPLVR